MDRVRWCCVLVVFLITSCSESVTLRVESNVPVALVQKFPISVGVYFDAAVRNHRYEENTAERPNWQIETGDAHLAMFERVLNSNFEELVILEQRPSENHHSPASVNLVPNIKEMQFATPEETFFDSYESWIRYSIEFLDASGLTLDTWVLTAYGKAPSTRFGSRSDGLNRAISAALRDIGAKLATGLPQHRLIQAALP